MVKVTGGGRGMGAIAAHFRYISKNGRLEMEDERGTVSTGKEALEDLLDAWRYGGSFIDEVSPRREAFNVMLSMPAGTDAMIVQRAVREFVKAELANHQSVMVPHDHQANPHVHIAVRAEGMDGTRLNPRKADLRRWRETFAEKLRGWGVEAEASRQSTRGANRSPEPLWRLKARSDGRLRSGDARGSKTGDAYRRSRTSAMDAWKHIGQALSASDRPEDRKLAEKIFNFLRGTPFQREEQIRRRAAQAARDIAPRSPRDKDGPEAVR